MPSFEFAMMNAYYNEHLKQFGKLAEAASLIDWETFRPIIASSYQNLTEKGSRPNIDCIVMLKLLVLQHWYGLSDPELERQTARDLIFQHFLGFPSTVPDFTTAWLFLECPSQTGSTIRFEQNSRGRCRGAGSGSRRGEGQPRTQRSSQRTRSTRPWRSREGMMP